MYDKPRHVVASRSIMVFLIRLFGHGLGRLPIVVQLFFGDLLGLLAYFLVSKRRRIVQYNLSVAFGELSPVELTRLTRKHFSHLGRSFIELFSQPALGNERLRNRKIKFSGFEKIDAVLAKGQAAGILTAHMGNWELMSCIAALGYDLSALYKAQDTFFDRLLISLRTTCGLKVLANKDGLRTLIREIRAGHVIGILADQGGLDPFDFFGESARFPMGAAAFALRHGVVNFPVFSIRQDDGTILITVEDAIIPEALEDREATQQDFQRRYIEILENCIRKHPEQYYWVHDVWRHFKQD